MAEPESSPPDLVLIGPEWPTRALLRAQLAEEGYEVVATDKWPIPRQYLRPGLKPRLLVIDLHGLPEPEKTLDELRLIFTPDCVMVVTALGSLSIEQVRRLGFHAVPRPASVGDIVARVAALLGRSGKTERV